MFTDYAYKIEGPTVVIKGILQVEFDYFEVGAACVSPEFTPRAENIRAIADSGDIIDGDGRAAGAVELETDAQRARWGRVVLNDCRRAIEAACVAAHIHNADGG